jgi:hypothetical protein
VYAGGQHFSRFLSICPKRVERWGLKRCDVVELVTWDRICHYICLTWDVEYTNVKFVFEEDINTVTNKVVEFGKTPQGS